MRSPIKHFAALCALLLLCCLGLSGCGSAAPAAPGSIRTEADREGILVRWEASEGAEYYRLYRLAEGTDFKYLCDLSGTDYLDTEVKNDQSYRYRVEAVSGKGVSAAVDSGPVHVVKTPELLSLVSGGGTAEAAWSSTGADTYRLYGSTDGETWFLLTETAEHTCTVSSGAWNHLAVSAVHQGLESALSDPVLLLSQRPKVDSASRLDKWTVVVLASGGGTEQYEVYRSRRADGDYSLLGLSEGPAYYDPAGAEEGTFFYRVRAVSGISSGPLSDPAPTGKSQRSVCGVPVFMYHEFITQADLDAGVAFDQYAIWKDEFEQDLIWLRDNGYTTITTRQLADFLSGGAPLPEKPVLLTIDDGKYGVYKNCYPLLQKYGMKASLSVIGAWIDLATQDPEERAGRDAPYCTWDEIGEMASSGCVEIVSHTFGLHVFSHNGRRGANCAPAESLSDFLPSAQKDYQIIQRQITDATGSGTVAQAYPYSSRSKTADLAWLQCGYQILLSGDDSDTRQSYINWYIGQAGVNSSSALTRRMVRMTGTPISTYMREALRHDAG